MRKRILAYLDFVDQVLAYKLDVTTSFSDDGEHGERLVKDTIPTRKIMRNFFSLTLIT
jgi:hypothetical protein